MEGFLTDLDTLDARQYLIAIKRLADNLSYGTDHSPYLGSGIEYVQSRPYQWGDAVRSIDWRVTARTGRVHVKEYEAPKRMPCFLLLDTSASMTVSSVKRSKYATAVHLAGGIALACLDRVSPVGIFGLGSRDLRVDPSLSRDQVLQWLHRLRRFRYDEETRLSTRLAQLCSSLHHRVLMIVLSDLHDPSALTGLKRSAQLHDVAVLHLRDPAEAGLRGVGFLRAREAESGQMFVTHGRRRFLSDESLEQELRRAGIDYLRLATDQPFIHQLRHFLARRHLLGRGAR